MSRAFKEYEKARGRNLDTEQIALILGAVLKDDTVEAFSECKAFNQHIEEKNKELAELSKELQEKYTNAEQREYFKELDKINDFQTVESELKLCQDGIKFLQLKKELLTKEV